MLQFEKNKSNSRQSETFRTTQSPSTRISISLMAARRELWRPQHSKTKIIDPLLPGHFLSYHASDRQMNDMLQAHVTSYMLTDQATSIYNIQKIPRAIIIVIFVRQL